ncbi:apolipoprotein D-like [Ctenocephalides felis]|uniref:apolipoprotein D-like n=1 Tax=Ctenocephalides felis TaxID=7515 RepID=UPI000E6E2B37|nr:apolipoprotein D-like [Ctenocephalides felis]
MQIIKMISKIILVLASFVFCVQCQVPFLGTCPEVKVVQDFDITKYVGKWYEAERYFAVFQFGGKCVTATYKLSHENSTSSIKVTNRQIGTITGISTEIEGYAKLGNARSTEGKLKVTFPSLPVDFDAPYWVLGTDYENFAVVWSCNDLGFLNTRNAWILTRQRKASVEIMKKAYAIIDENKITRAYFIRTNQQSCPSQY